MGWDKKHKGFNYYRSIGKGRWAFAGNSRHALSPPTNARVAAVTWPAVQGRLLSTRLFPKQR